MIALCCPSRPLERVSSVRFGLLDFQGVNSYRTHIRVPRVAGTDLVLERRSLSPKVFWSVPCPPLQLDSKSTPTMMMPTKSKVPYDCTIVVDFQLSTRRTIEQHIASFKPELLSALYVYCIQFTSFLLVFSILVVATMSSGGPPGGKGGKSIALMKQRLGKTILV